MNRNDRKHISTELGELHEASGNALETASDSCAEAEQSIADAIAALEGL